MVCFDVCAQRSARRQSARRAKQLAARSGRTLTAMIGDALRMLLARGRAQPRSPRPELPVSKAGTSCPASISTMAPRCSTAWKGEATDPSRRQRTHLRLPNRGSRTRRVPGLAGGDSRVRREFWALELVLSGVVRWRLIHGSLAAGSREACTGVCRRSASNRTPCSWRRLLVLGLLAALPRDEREGNLVADAYLAALALKRGEWITTDRDYARFPGFAGGIRSSVSVYLEIR